jgi:hemoglobin-like flavoprotein
MENDSTKFVKILEHVARAHSGIGVKAVEYGIFFEVMMYAMQKCVGSEIWTPCMAHGWIKIFSCMLKIIIPVVVRHEFYFFRALSTISSFTAVIGSSRHGSVETETF